MQTKQMPVPDTKIGQVTGKIGTFAKAPPMDKNYVSEQKGNGDKNQLGFNKKHGV